MMDVGPRTVPCQAEGVRQCMRVRLGSDTAWTNFFDRIEGFTHEAGFRYRLQIERHIVEHPQADASRFRYRLVRIVSQVADPSG